jgi:hypothetical protein
LSLILWRLGQPGAERARGLWALTLAASLHVAAVALTLFQAASPPRPIERPASVLVSLVSGPATRQASGVTAPSFLDLEQRLAKTSPQVSTPSYKPPETSSSKLDDLIKSESGNGVRSAGEMTLKNFDPYVFAASSIERQQEKLHPISALQAKIDQCPAAQHAKIGATTLVIDIDVRGQPVGLPKFMGSSTIDERRRTTIVKIIEDCAPYLDITAGIYGVFIGQK